MAKEEKAGEEFVNESTEDRENRNKRLEEFNARYNSLRDLIYGEDFGKMKEDNRAHYKTNRNDIYKHYIGQGLKYAICFGVLGFGIAMLTVPTLLAGVAFPIVFGTSLKVIGGAVLAGLGSLGAFFTRLRHNPNYEIVNDFRRIKYLRRESRRMRRIERFLKSQRDAELSNPQNVKTYQAKIEKELKAYENDALKLERLMKNEYGASARRFANSNSLKRFMFWAGTDRYENFDAIHLAHLQNLREGALMQLKIADGIRKEAGLKQNDSVVARFNDVKDEIKNARRDFIKVTTENNENVESVELHTEEQDLIDICIEGVTSGDANAQGIIKTISSRHNISAEKIINSAGSLQKNKKLEIIKFVASVGNFDKIEEEQQDMIINFIQGMNTGKSKLSAKDKKAIKDIFKNRADADRLLNNASAANTQALSKKLDKTLA